MINKKTDILIRREKNISRVKNNSNLYQILLILEMLFKKI